MRRVGDFSGQALTELAILLVPLLILFFCCDFICSFLMAQNRAHIYLHQQIFADYRRSEDLSIPPAPHPDPTHLHLTESSEHFSGRLWWQPTFAESILDIEFLPHFPHQAKLLAHLEPKPYRSSAKGFRDPWYQHPIRYAVIAAATAKAMAQNLSGQNFSINQFESVLANASSAITPGTISALNPLDLLEVP